MERGSDRSFAVTPAGWARLEAEFRLLSGERKLALIERLEEAKSGAEFVENTELMVALEDLKQLDQRIERLRYLLSHASIIENDAQDGFVHLGSRVTIQFDGDEPEQYRVVGSIEADPDSGFISDVSPLGRAILNQPAGETPLMIQTPGGPMIFRILKVE